MTNKFTIGPQLTQDLRDKSYGKSLPATISMFVKHIPNVTQSKDLKNIKWFTFKYSVLREVNSQGLGKKMSRTIKIVSYWGHNRSRLLIKRRKIHVDGVLLVFPEMEVFEKVIKYLCGWLALGHFTREMIGTRPCEFFYYGPTHFKDDWDYVRKCRTYKIWCKIDRKTSILDPLLGSEVRWGS